MRPASIVEAAVYTAITFTATVLLAVSTPATGGYFNLGEAAIYAIAVLASTPLVAAVAAGLGPAIADIVLGYGYFAPATLVIKFAEGFIVAYLVGKIREGSLPQWAPLGSAALSIAMALILIIGLGGLGGEAGVNVYWTEARLLGVTLPLPTLELALPPIVWWIVALGVVAVGLLPLVARGEKPLVAAMATGGVVMITGYFLYEFFISNPIILGRDPLGAIFEIPVNVGQVAAGILLSYPVVRFVEKARGHR
ncbi:MAG: ECF transporter S component [Aeropyrum sp.]|nr:ECF transporter S component [Aeropyrum sp.]MCE4616768.1 ECF transporter S component [Aeropyrum sp.]